MPTESTVQTFMKRFMGRAPALNDKAQIENISFRQRVVASIVDTTVTVEDSGTLFSNEGATEAEIVWTLPAPTADDADGCVFWFYAAEDLAIKVTSGTADLMVAFDDVAATSVSFETANEIIGGGFKIVGDGAKWFCMGYLGGDAQTITVA